jgi:hypothetical protein
VIATNFGTLTGGANALAFTIRAGALLGGNLTTLYFVYNSQSGEPGPFIWTIFAWSGVVASRRPDFESSPTETRPRPSAHAVPHTHSDETMVPTDTQRDRHADGDLVTPPPLPRP